MTLPSVTGYCPSPDCCGAETLTVPFRCAILGCAGQFWDVAEGSLAAEGTKKLSKAWGVPVLAKELVGHAPGCLVPLLYKWPVILVCNQGICL